MSDKRYQVFVSSTYIDLHEKRRKVIEALMKVDSIPVGMESFPASDDNAWNYIKRIIDQSDYYIVIIGGKYGSMNTDGVSYTELEYDYACENGIPIMAFIHADPNGLRVDQAEVNPVIKAKLERFKNKAKSRLCRFWTNDEELIRDVLASYIQTISTYQRPGWVRGDQAKTVEDVEERLLLEQKVHKLEQQIAKNENDIEYEIKTIYNELQSTYAIRIKYAEIEGTIDFTLMNIFNIILNEIITPCETGNLARKLIGCITTEVGNTEEYISKNMPGSPFDNINIGFDIIDIVNNYIIRGLVAVTLNPSNGKTLYQLTKIGREFILYFDRNDMLRETSGVLPNLGTID